MLDLTNLPNELTDFDEDQISAIIENPDITIRLYKDGKEYTVVSDYPEKNSFEVITPHINLNQTLDNVMQESHYLVEKGYLNSIPQEDNTLFSSFKNDLIIAEIYHGEDLNIENPFISEFHGDLVDHEYVIYEPQTNVYLFYNPSQEHVFFVEHNEDVFLFDSLDAALKLVYESAIKEDYKSPQVKKFEDFLDSEYAQKLMDSFVEEMKAEDEKLEELKSSGKYEKALLKLKEDLLLRNRKSISSEDFIYDADSVSFIDEDLFYDIIDISLANENVYSDETNPFENYAVNINGLHIHQMIGQGIISSISIQ